MVTQLFFVAIYNGYPTFVVAIFGIGACTAVIGDVAGHLGCFIYLKDGVNAIAFVALGTSVPGPQAVHAVDCRLFCCIVGPLPFSAVIAGSQPKFWDAKSLHISNRMSFSLSCRDC